MNSLALADAAAARLTSRIPSRTVYSGAVPDGPLPERYLIVWASEGSEESTRSPGSATVQTPALWVTSVSRNPSPLVAAREAAWAAGKVRAALRGWRPESAWLVRAEVSSPPRRDESIAATTFAATEQFSLRSSL